MAMNHVLRFVTLTIITSLQVTATATTPHQTSFTDINPIDHLEPFETCGKTPIFETFERSAKLNTSANARQLKITNGFAVKRGEFPSYAAIYELATNHQVYPPWCGGVLVGRRLVLTAAHCVENERRPFKIVLGLYDRSQRIEDVLEVTAKSWCVHDLRNQPPQSNDLAVIYLSEPVKYRLTIQPACVHFNTPNATLFQTRQSDDFTLTGIGLMSGQRDADRLYKAFFRYFHPHGATIDDSPGASVVRSTERFTQACHGDSGSPLYYYRDSSGRDRMSCRDDMQLRHFVSGLVSRGTTCDNDTFSIEYRANIERQEEDLLYIMRQIILLNEFGGKEIPKNCYKYTE